MAELAALQKQFSDLMNVVTEERQLREKAEIELAAAKQAAKAATNLANANALTANAVAAPKGPKMGLPDKFNGTRREKAANWARWGSLREMRLHLYKRRHMREVVAWLYSCIVLHNMLAQLGDQWQELEAEDQNLGGVDSSPEQPAGPSDVAFRKRVKHACVAYNYEKGVLPS
ncbi:hypothetical protein KEM48_005892 [Puccinia striiformis f. sp. tritici PST-130]|nr:hypothetical protein KEM48_005892 [Puccinia striiformis f. sp. tritici PST-130]